MRANRKLIRIHNAQTALEGFGFPGIEAYSTRATTSSGGFTIVTESGDAASLWSAHRYLEPLGLGPFQLKVIQTAEDGDLYAAILANPKLSREIVAATKQGSKIQFFCTRAGIEERFIEALGLSWGCVASLPSVLADTWNDKAEVRRIVARNNLPNFFPHHMFPTSPEELEQMVSSMLQLYDYVVIKRPSWSSGSGMVHGNTTSIVKEYLGQHDGLPADTIVERWLPDHIAMSILIRYEDGVAVDTWVTEQGSDSQQESLILGDMPNVTRADTVWMKEATAPLYALLLEQYPNLTGVINFDCLRKGTKRFVLECNARCTFSTYLQEIRRGIELGRAGYLPTCALRKVTPTSAHDFQSLRAELGGLMLRDPMGVGVIPIVLGCLPANGYCYLVSIADNHGDAVRLLDEATDRLAS